jgi:hypothetical protein
MTQTKPYAAPYMESDGVDVTLSVTCMPLHCLDTGTPLPQRSTQIKRPYESVISVLVNSTSFGDHRSFLEIIPWSAREDEYLKTMGFLVKQRTEPIHATFVTLNVGTHPETRFFDGAPKKRKLDLL